MPRLKPEQFKALKHALQDAFSTIPSLESLAARLGYELDEIAIGPNVGVIIERMIRWGQQEQVGLSNLLWAALEERPENLLLQRVKLDFLPVIELDATDHYQVLVLRDGSVLVDRDDLRSALRQLDDVRSIAVVQGRDRSGKTYTKELIRHLHKMRGRLRVAVYRSAGFKKCGVWTGDSSTDRR